MYQFLDDGRVIDVRTRDVVSESDAAFKEWLARGNLPAMSQRDIDRADAWERIKARREAVKAGGVQVAGHWFHSDSDSRIQQLGLVMMGQAMPAGLQWKTMGGGFVLMTPALALQIFQATAARDAAVFGAAEAHRAAMMAAPEPASYSFSAGWPASFTGGQ